MPGVSAAAVVVVFALDTAVGKWPEGLHPVAWYGTVVSRIDRGWRRLGVAGGLAAFVLAGVVAWH